MWRDDAGMRNAAAVLLALAALSLAARADEAATDAPPPDPVWLQYESAFQLSAEGRFGESEETLERLVREHPEHPAAALAKDILRMLDAQAAGDARLNGDGATETPHERDVWRDPPAGPGPALPADLGKRLRAEKPSALARAELAILQTAHGIAAGAEFCTMADCDDVRPFVVSILVGGGAGLGISLAATGGGITAGRTLALNSGTGWGVWHGIAINLIAETELDTPFFATMLAAQALGTAAGGLIGYHLRPGAGDVSLANSAGIWSGVLMLLLNAATEFELIDGSRLAAALLAATDVGLLAGALVARETPMSRGRTLIIDAGGILGMLLGFGIDVLIQGEQFQPGPFFGLGIGGTVAGLATATALTKSWDLTEDAAAGPEPRTMLIPIDGGAILTLSQDF